MGFHVHSVWSIPEFRHEELPWVESNGSAGEAVDWLCVGMFAIHGVLAFATMSEEVLRIAFVVLRGEGVEISLDWLSLIIWER